MPTKFKQKQINKLEQKQITKEINKVLNQGFKINVQSDEDFLKTCDYKWEDLDKLKEDLGASIIEFIKQVNTIITTPEIINNLGDKKSHFNKVVNLFFSDINEFSHKVKEIRLKHENMSGPIKNINDFDNYNRIAIQYHSLFSELATLITPTLSDLMLTISEIENNQNSEITKNSEVANGYN